MSYQANIKHERMLIVYCLVKRNHLKNLHTMWLQLYDTGKVETIVVIKRPVLPRVQGEEWVRDEQVEHGIFKAVKLFYRISNYSMDTKHHIFVKTHRTVEHKQWTLM